MSEVLTKKVSKPTVKPYRGWLLSNMNNPWGVFNRRDQAKQGAEEWTGQPWSECSKYMFITRCEVKQV